MSALPGLCRFFCQQCSPKFWAGRVFEPIVVMVKGEVNMTPTILENRPQAAVEPGDPVRRAELVDRGQVPPGQGDSGRKRTRQRIVILGGGFGGFYTARRLEKLF